MLNASMFNFIYKQQNSNKIATKQNKNKIYMYKLFALECCNACTFENEMAQAKKLV